MVIDPLKDLFLLTGSAGQPRTIATHYLNLVAHVRLIELADGYTKQLHSEKCGTNRLTELAVMFDLLKPEDIDNKGSRSLENARRILSSHLIRTRKWAAICAVKNPITERLFGPGNGLLVAISCEREREKSPCFASMIGRDISLFHSNMERKIQATRDPQIMFDHAERMYNCIVRGEMPRRSRLESHTEESVDAMAEPTLILNLLM